MTIKELKRATRLELIFDGARVRNLFIALDISSWGRRSNDGHENRVIIVATIVSRQYTLQLQARLSITVTVMRCDGDVTHGQPTSSRHQRDLATGSGKQILTSKAYPVLGQLLEAVPYKS